MSDLTTTSRRYITLCRHSRGCFCTLRVVANAANVVATIAVCPKGPCLIDAKEDKIVYDITIELPDAGHIPTDKDTAELPGAASVEVTASTRCYPTQSCRSVLGNQLYNAFAPRMQILQLGEVQAHRSAFVVTNK